MIPNFQELCCLKRLEPADQRHFVAAATESDQHAWLHYFPFLYTFALSSKRTLLWERVDDAICVYFLRSGDRGLRLDLYLPPFPYRPEALDTALARTNRFNEDRSARITWVDEATRPAIEAAGLRLRPIEQEFIYDAEAVRKAQGRHFERLRRHLNRSRRIPGLLVRDYRASDRAACEELLARWQRTLRRNKGLTVLGSSYARRCLEHAFTFADGILKGQVITLDGAVVAFSFGGAITPSYASLFITITDHEVSGLGYLLRYAFMQRHPWLRFVNDSSDAGRPGLAEVKRAFNPVEMHALYRAYQPHRDASGPQRRSVRPSAAAAHG